MQTSIETPIPEPLAPGGGLAETGSESISTLIVGLIILALVVGRIVYLILGARRLRGTR